jgi:predicted outer membrane repeat protein
MPRLTGRFLITWGLLSIGAFVCLGFPNLPALAQLSPTGASIQSLVDAAPDGGTVSLAGITYSESITINKSITLTGVSSATTVIQAVAGQRVILVTDGHDLRLANLTIAGGHPPAAVGGGVMLVGGSLRISNCIIANNSADYGGGAFQENPKGSPGRLEIIESRLENNTASLVGGSVFARGTLYLTSTDVLSSTAGLYGGGIHADAGSASLSGGLFGNNRAIGNNGGAVNANNGLSIAGTRFISNTAQQKGGAVLQWNPGLPIIIADALFEHNQAALEGGGVWTGGNLTVTGSSFLTNTVDTKSAANGSGGGLSVNGGTLWMDTSTFRGNEVHCSGCTFRDGGGLSVVSSPHATIQDSLFEANSAWSGGGLFSSSPNLTISGSIFRRNTAGYGGALEVGQADVRVSTFTSNTTTNSGGAIASGIALSVAASTFTSNSAGAAGGAIWASGNLSLLNSAFSGSESGWGGEVIHLDNNVARVFTHVTISQPATNSGAAIRVAGGTLAITNSIIASYTVGISQTSSSVAVNGLLWSGGPSAHAGTGSYTETSFLAAAPLFEADGYHLTKASPAIDHGVSSGVLSDIDGNPRPWGAGYDLGAAEYPRYRAYLPLAQRQ